MRGEVKGSRVEAARSQKAAGKLGVAWVYLQRALALDPNDAAAKSELTDVEGKLKGRLAVPARPVSIDDMNDTIAQRRRRSGSA